MNDKKGDRKSEAKGGEIKVIAQNRKARFDYHIIETFEAGMVLTGAEIKSIRAGDITLSESYISPTRGELFLIRAHIKGYRFNHDPDYDPIRPRKLLMHRSEIDKLSGQVQKKGLTIVPLQIHLRRGRAKIELGLAKGKAAPDKRDTIKERDSKRELARELKRGG